MLSKHLKLDIITFGTLIKGYMSHGLVDHGISIYRKHFWTSESATQAQGATSASPSDLPQLLKPNEVIFNTLLDGCVKNNRCDQALQLFNEITNPEGGRGGTTGPPGAAGAAAPAPAPTNTKTSSSSRLTTKFFTPSHFTLTICIKMYGRLEMVDDALQLVHDWPILYGITLNNHVFTCLLSALLSNHYYKDALEIPALMRQAEVQPDARTYGTLALGLLRTAASRCSADWVTAAVRQVVVNAFKEGVGVEFETLHRICKQDGSLYGEVAKIAREQRMSPEAKAVVDKLGGILYRQRGVGAGANPCSGGGYDAAYKYPPYNNDAGSSCTKSGAQAHHLNKTRSAPLAEQHSSCKAKGAKSSGMMKKYHPIYGTAGGAASTSGHHATYYQESHQLYYQSYRMGTMMGW
eukprot:g13484.t1